MTTDVREAARQRGLAQQAAQAAVAVREGDQLTIRPEQTDWEPRQLAALGALGIKDVGPADLDVFLHVCRTSGLNPFIKQIYLIPRTEFDPNSGRRVRKWVIQTGIGGFRLIRDRAGARDGWTASYEDTIWYNRQGQPFTLWLPGASEAPFACKVTMLKVLDDGTVAGRYPAIVRYDAYADVDSDGRPRNRWRNDPDGQLAKCAEAAALRKGCPQDLGHLYIEEEMARDTDGTPPAQRRPRRTVQAKADPPAEPAQPAAPASADPPEAEPVEGTVVEPANPVDGDLEEQRKTALGVLHQVFRAAGWGEETDEHHRVRVLVAAGFGRAQDGDPPLSITTTAELDVWQAGRAADRLRTFAETRGEAAHAALERVAASVAAELDKGKGTRRRGKG